MTFELAQTRRPTTAARPSPTTLIALAARGRADRRRLQRLGRLLQPRRLPRGVPRPPDQRRHRRAGPRRRRRRPGQRRAASRSSPPPRPFLTGRALEQIKADVAYSNAHVVLCGQSPGMAYGELGPTHHSIEDLSWTRAIDEPARSLVPADPAQTRAAVRWAVANPGPLYLRVPRFKVPGRHAGRRAVRARPRDPAHRRRRRHGDRRSGTMVSRALEAAEQLRGRRHRRPRAQHAVRRPAGRRRRCCDAARETRGIVTAEEAHRHRRPRRRGRRASSPSTSPCRCASSASPAFAPTGSAELPARPLRPDRRRHRRRRRRGA